MDGEVCVEGMSPGDAVIVIGPPMTGKYEFLLRLLSTYADRPVFVSTRNPAGDVREDYREIAGDGPADRMRIVDCVSRHEPVEGGEGEATISYVSSPQNLTRIGVTFTEHYEALLDEPFDGHTGVGLHSISQLLMHADVRSVYQFMQVLAGQIRGAGWTAVAAADTGTVDEEGIRMLQHHFDGTVETRETEDGGREFRTRGLTPTASEWRRF